MNINFTAPRGGFWSLDDRYPIPEPDAMDGFAFSVGADGRFLYISETVSIYLGLSQVEVTGSSIFDYIHQNDHSKMGEQLGLGLTTGSDTNLPSPGSDNGCSNTGTNNPDVSSVMSISSTMGDLSMHRSFCIRMKSTLTKRGCHFKSSGFRVVLVLCRFRPQHLLSHTGNSNPPLLGISAIAIALPPFSLYELRLESDMFVMRLSYEFKVIHCEPRVSELLDFSAAELAGQNLYLLCHAEDVNVLRISHLDLLGKGQMMSHYYRIMTKKGGYIWIQSCAMIVSNSKSIEEQSIVCVNYVISGREFSNVSMDCCQMAQECLAEVKTEVVEEYDKKPTDEYSTVHLTGHDDHRPNSVTHCKPPVPHDRRRIRSNLVVNPNNNATGSIESDATNIAVSSINSHLTGSASPPESHWSKGRKRKKWVKETETSTATRVSKQADSTTTKDLGQLESRQLSTTPLRALAFGTISGIGDRTEALLRRHQHYEQTPTAIQWTEKGSYLSHNLPVTAFLGEVYPTRESVIRTNVLATSNFRRDNMSVAQLPFHNILGLGSFKEQSLNRRQYEVNDQKPGAHFPSFLAYPFVSNYACETAVSVPGSQSPQRKRVHAGLHPDQSIQGDHYISSNSLRPSQSNPEQPFRVTFPVKSPQPYGYFPTSAIDAQLPSISTIPVT